MSTTDDNLVSIEELLDTGRMREQLAIARRIQLGFLPKAPPGLQAFEIEGWNQPCYETGGDYFDFLRLPGGRLGLAIGDVSSHGIGPALLMANARSALRALLQVSERPSDVAARLNDVLVADMPEDHFMTMFVGMLDLRTKRLRFAVAGHERPLRRKPDPAVHAFYSERAARFGAGGWLRGVQDLLSDRAAALQTGPVGAGDLRLPGVLE